MILDVIIHLFIESLGTIFLYAKTLLSPKENFQLKYFFSFMNLNFIFFQVAVKNKRLRDTPGVKLTCVRGLYDLPHVVKKTS